MEAIPTKENEVSKIQTFGNRITNWISGGGDQNYKTISGYKTIGFCIGWDYITIEKEIDV